MKITPEIQAILDRVALPETDPQRLTPAQASALMMAQTVRAEPRTRRTADTMEGEYDSLLMDAVTNDQAHAHATDAYHQIPTSSLIPALRDVGWYEYAGKGAPRFQPEPNTRGIETAMRLHNLDWDAARAYLIRTGKHMITLRHRDYTPEKVGDLFIQSYLTNASNRTCPVTFNLGAFRLACLNGMLSQRDGFSLSIAHNVHGLTVDRVINSFLRLSANAPLMLEQIREYHGINLTESQKHAFAREAIKLRWDSTIEGTDGKIRDNACVPTTSEVLAYRRGQDNASDLWTVSNVVQENLLRGGYQRPSQRANSRKTTTTVRSLGGINAFVNINAGIDELSYRWFKEITNRELEQPAPIDVNYTTV